MNRLFHEAYRRSRRKLVTKAGRTLAARRGLLRREVLVVLRQPTGADARPGRSGEPPKPPPRSARPSPSRSSTERRRRRAWPAEDLVEV
jgi:hypothetical protein